MIADMPPDKFSATWVSHSSISDFLTCPRAYFLKNVYKDPSTGHKIAIMTPPLALGQAVHEVIENLSNVKAEERFRDSLLPKFEAAWKKVSGKRGGFSNESQEQRSKQRGEDMLRNVMSNPGPLKNLSVKIKMELPYFWLSEPDEIILCGKIDWLEYLPDSDTVHIIDFKTGRNDEKGDSLQLPIYHLLVANCQKRRASKASYWYVARSEEPVEQPLPGLEEARQKVLEIAKKLKVARKLNVLKCPHGGCAACKPFEAVLRGEAELVGLDEIRRDVYILNHETQEDTSEIL